MNKKIIVIILVIAFVLSGVSVADASNSASVSISVTNSLPLPVYKKVDISVSIPKIKSSDKIAVFLKGKKIPIQILSRGVNSLRFSTILSFAPNETKILILKYGKDVIPNKTQILYKPNFSGTYFVGIGSGKLYIASLADDNNISVKSNNGNVLFSGVLNKKEFKAISLSRDEVFTIQSKKPVFAEVSSLKANCLKNSSDDVSSVYGTYFLLFIPREVVVSSYASTKLTIKSLSGNNIYSGTLPPRGQYKNFSLRPGLYEISTNYPVTVQFGCEDDNIYSINYGASNEFKGVSYGNVVCSALFPNTKVQIKTPFKTYPYVNLGNPGDYIYKTVITKYKDSYTETVPVFIQYNKPILVYSDSNHGNIGGEQIPSLFGHNEHYVFLTGKIFNFNGLVHRRKVVVIPMFSDTTIKLNGKQYALKDALMPKTFLFGKSYTSVKIDSNKPISVFDVGLTTSIEFLSMILPLKDNSVSYVVGAIPPKTSTQNNNGRTQEPNEGVLSRYITPIAGFFGSVWSGIEKTSIYKSVSNTLSQFWQAISPSLNNLSRQIIALFIPVAQMVYPYVHPYFPNLTVSELAAILFYLLIALIIILLIPKRRKKQIPVEKVTEAELKKKGNVAFNVKTIEEKGISGIKAAPTGKPKVLVSKYSKKQEGIVSKKNEPVRVERKSITIGGQKSEEKKATVKAAKQPLQIFKHPAGTEETKKIEKRTSEKLPTTGPLQVKEKTAPLEKAVENVPSGQKKGKAETPQEGVQQLSKELALKKILNKNLNLTQQGEVKKPLTEKPSTKAKEVVIKGKSLSETRSPEAAIESERIAEVLKKLKETTAKISEQSKNLKETDRREEKTATPTNTVSSNVQATVKPKTNETSIIKNTEKPIIEKTPAEAKEPESANHKVFGVGRLFGRKKVEVSGPTGEGESAVSGVGKAEEGFEESVKEKAKPEESPVSKVKEESLEVSDKQNKEESSREEKIHTSLSELIEKVRREPQAEQNINTSAGIQVGKEVIEKVSAEEKVGQSAGISISGSAALDSGSLSELYKLHALEHLSRIIISAKDQPNVDPDIKTKYRISVISLTGIELRIAEDLARRIGAKKSTGELLLIAKKTRISKIIVDDRPKITNYQGIKIVNISELTGK